MHILLRVILSPPTNELQLLMSFPGRRLLRKRCARSMFALFEHTSDLTFGDCRACVALKFGFRWISAKHNTLLEELHFEEANRDLGRVVSLQSMQKRADCETGSWKIQRSFSP